RLQYGKTVAMLRVAAEIACILAGADDDTTAACIAYCENVGKAFQIRDDILDVIADEAALGKPIGSDEECGKNTYVTLLGLKKAQALCDELTDNAVSSIKSLKNSENLAELAILLCSREK
ncbi:MAG: polyprenyl synthetase family protein, partial [Acutalibacteraceae bacterium]|nr:polyprenyl synthetase family protein [Acutalibacteraceae bacterium]